MTLANANGHETVSAMSNITVGRYNDPAALGYQGYIEPEDRSWICYVRLDGSAEFCLDRDPETGAVR